MVGKLIRSLEYQVLVTSRGSSIKITVMANNEELGSENVDIDFEPQDVGQSTRKSGMAPIAELPENPRSRSREERTPLLPPPPLSSPARNRRDSRQTNRQRLRDEDVTEPGNTPTSQWKLLSNSRRPPARRNSGESSKKDVLPKLTAPWSKPKASKWTQAKGNEPVMESPLPLRSKTSLYSIPRFDTPPPGSSKSER